MSLVAYGESSGEDSSEEDTEHSLPKSSLESKPTEPPEPSLPKSALETKPTEPSENLFSYLPAPRKSIISTEDEIKDIPLASSKPKQLVKITIPSLKELKTDEDDEAEEVQRKKFKPSSVGSGLLGMLPKPQNLIIKQAGRQLTPSIINRKVANKLPPKAAVKPVISSSKEGKDSDDEEVTDFFSLDSSPPKTSLTESSLEHSMVNQTMNIAAPIVDYNYPSLSADYFYNKNAETNYYDPMQRDFSGEVNQKLEEPTQIGTFEDAAGSSGLPLDILNDERFLRLKGRTKEEVNFIEINGSDQMPKPEDWLKSISEEQTHRPAHKKGQMPNAQSRRKHQITYLAYQAKERELELKNQWAMNRLTKKQTQAKYGF